MGRKPWAKHIAPILLLVLVLAGAYMLTRYVSLDALKAIGEERRLLGAVLLASLMFATTVAAPLVSLPLVPMVAPILGPFTTGLASFIGWSLGAVVAFLIGRYYGQPVVSRFVNMETIQKYEAYIDPHMSFMLIVMLRMVLPVDVLSYALGIFTSVTLVTYTAATMLGIVWFSFAFAYLGEALIGGNYVLFAAISVASIAILYVSWRYVRRVVRSKNTEQ
jgi:uncharacterized membrane protein YdjX (TVP38/TMEM64 family)